MSVLAGTEWIEAGTGSFVVVPGHVTHDFENRGAERAGVLNVSAPGNFEQHMRVSRSGSPSILPAIRTPEPRYGRVPPRPPAPGHQEEYWIVHSFDNRTRGKSSRKRADISFVVISAWTVTGMVQWCQSHQFSRWPLR
jgi:hypothetical protein